MLSTLDPLQVHIHTHTPTHDIRLVSVKFYHANLPFPAPSPQFSDSVLVASLLKRMASNAPKLCIGLDNVASTAKSQEIIDSFLTGSTDIDSAMADLRGFMYNALTAAASNTATSSPRR